MTHGIGGGAIAADEPATAFYPVNWLDLARGAGGLTMIDFGTLKHVQRNGVCICGPRLGRQHGAFRQSRRQSPTAIGSSGSTCGSTASRCSGSLFIRTTAIGDAAGVPDVAMSLLRPPVAAAGVCANDAKPTSKTLLAIDGALVPTSVYADGNRLVCRVYEPYGKKPEFILNHLGKNRGPGHLRRGRKTRRGNPCVGNRQFDLGHSSRSS